MGLFHFVVFPFGLAACLAACLGAHIRNKLFLLPAAQFELHWRFVSHDSFESVFALKMFHFFGIFRPVYFFFIALERVKKKVCFPLKIA